MKCVQGHKTCKGPYAPSGAGFVCLECSVYHDENPSRRCRCDDCKRAREEKKRATTRSPS